jgi:hypothetical protein
MSTSSPLIRLVTAGLAVCGLSLALAAGAWARPADQAPGPATATQSQLVQPLPAVRDAHAAIAQTRPAPAPVAVTAPKAGDELPVVTIVVSIAGLLLVCGTVAVLIRRPGHRMAHV